MSKVTVNEVYPVIQVGYDKTAEDVIQNTENILGLVEELDNANIDYTELPRLCGYIIAELCEALEDFDDIFGQITE